MCANYVELGMLAVQTLGLIGLAFYCFETRNIRIASQDQVIASQKLIKAAMDQVEGALKPCITFATRLREASDTIWDAHGAVGNLIVDPDQGNYVIKNIGSGAALNLRYFFTRPDVLDPDWRYLSALVPPGRATLVETLSFFYQEHVATFEYESIGGRRYRSTINVNHHVITAFRFEEIAGGPLS